MIHCIKTRNEYAGVDTFQPLGFQMFGRKKSNLLLQIKFEIVYYTESFIWTGRMRMQLF